MENEAAAAAAGVKPQHLLLVDGNMRFHAN